MLSVDNASTLSACSVHPLSETRTRQQDDPVASLLIGHSHGRYLPGRRWRETPKAVPPGRRGWIKTKNREYWRYPLELNAATG